MLPRLFWIASWLSLAFYFGNLDLRAQQAEAPKRKIEFPKPATPDAPVESAVTNMQFKVVGPGVFQLGDIKMDKGKRTVSFPATLNRPQGPMEYFLVTKYGKTHESILRTEVKPYDVHIAMLLLGAGGSGTNFAPGGLPQNGPSQISNPSKEVLPGDKVTIEVKWTQDGKEVRRAAQDFVYNEQTHSIPEHAGWVYNGSFIAQGRFLAQMEGSIVSLITDPVALVNNISVGHDNDRIWTGNTNALPPADIPLEVVIKLEEPLEKK